MGFTDRRSLMEAFAAEQSFSNLLRARIPFVSASVKRSNNLFARALFPGQHL